MTGPPHNFQIHESPTDDSVRLSLTGELDLSSAPKLRARLAPLRAINSPVRLDLSKLEFIDSAGMHLLIRTIGEARMKGWSFRIEPDVAPQAMRLLRLFQLDHCFIGV